MTNKTLNVKVLNVTKTTEQWAAETSVISKGLLCVELAAEGKTMIKIGDGVKTYDQLPYITDGSFNISEYFTKDEVSAEIESKISALGDIMRIKGVKETTEQLPPTGNSVGDIWFVGSVGETSDSFAEYVWTADNKFEFLGKVQTDPGSQYILPVATKETLGGIKLGDSLTVDDQGVVTIPVATDTTPGLLSPEDKTAITELAEYDLTEFIKNTDALTLNCEL